MTLAAAASRPAGAQGTDDGDYDWIAADVTLQRTLHGASHEVPAPRVTYRVTHSRQGAGWKTVFEIRERELPIVQREDGPGRLPDHTRVARIEDDGDGSPVRFYDHAGARIRPSNLSDASVLGAPRNAKLPRAPRAMTAAGRHVDAADFRPLLISKRGAESRRAALQRRLGAPVGRSAGRDRYTRLRGEDMEEVLTDAEWAVPLELSIVQRGTRVAHTEITYQPGPGGSLVSRTIRSERALGGARPGRAVTTVTFSNVRADRGR